MFLLGERWGFMSAKNYRPIKFLDRMEGNNHIVLLYDNPKYADVVIARYLLNGLQKGESCIFFSPDEPKTIEERLSAKGIDVDSYKQANSLRIYRTERSDAGKLDMLSTLRRIREESTKGMRPPYRFVGRTITDTETKEGMTLGLAVEKSGHEHFEEFDCSQMCYYDISGIEQSRRDEWIRGLLKNHHHVIYASEPDKAVAFETMLLEDVE
ncbi:MEDS: MEthanogen/methylotroph, DcmR Sensory domain [Candidatus Nitrososphaera evergladensis SR1]|uniref:MEDS: MEthanogen/methylotroph, DcmR Sensory domain n=2 Tax=Nitrososphaera TaxID=497726 RepID=A0A075MSJ3_9ARCH|nr:MEDS: MEthanogen/methylotroph, DcmR Sensory domain [Candidatus Nitrososphaera evergladensis SR1]